MFTAHFIGGGWKTNKPNVILIKINMRVGEYIFIAQLARASFTIMKLHGYLTYFERF